MYPRANRGTDCSWFTGFFRGKTAVDEFDTNPEMRFGARSPVIGVTENYEPASEKSEYMCLGVTIGIIVGALMNETVRYALYNISKDDCK